MKASPRIVNNLKTEMQVLDREWRSLLVDDQIKSPNMKYSVESFWKKMSEVPAYNNISTFILVVLSLPQSTAGVERTFSKLNNDKTNLRNSLAVTTLEATIDCSETFKDTSDPNPRLVSLYGSARQRYMSKFEANTELVKPVEPVETIHFQ